MIDNKEFQEWEKCTKETFPSFQVWKVHMKDLLEPSSELFNNEGALAILYVASRKGFEEKTSEVQMSIPEMIFLIEKYCGENELVEMFKEEQDMDNFFDFLESVSEEGNE